MSTCPGASHELAPEMLDHELIRSASICFLEGYLWGPERPRAAMLEAAQIARSAGRTIAFTLSESLAIGDRREGVMRMVDAGLVDILFGNEHEIMHLTGCGALGDALAAVEGKVATPVATRGAAAAIALDRGERVEVSAAPVEKVVDTTGAGDLFAAGFLAARCRGRNVRGCLQAGSIAAAEIISHFGARPEANLKELAGL
jgi:sugar/nucleoside kinase (ribokinase family)